MAGLPSSVQSMRDSLREMDCRDGAGAWLRCRKDQKATGEVSAVGGNGQPPTVLLIVVGLMWGEHLLTECQLVGAPGGHAAGVAVVPAQGVVVPRRQVVRIGPQ